MAISTIDRITQIVADQLQVSEAEVTPNAHFYNDLGADSLDQIELVMELEEAFGISIPDDDVERLHTVQQVIDYVESKAR